MHFRNFNFNLTEVTSIVVDGSYLWIAYKEDDGTCKLRKVDKADLNQIFYDFEVPVDKIVRLASTGSNLYAIVEDDQYIALRYDKTDPLNDYDYTDIPSGINEYPIDLATRGLYLYILTPGSASGENAKVLRYIGTSMSLFNTIDLSKSADIIEDARSLDVDASSNIWIALYTDPAKLVKVFEVSGGDYDFTSYDII